MQIIREIAKKVAQIQNAGLGEFRIRDLNDEINKLLREKRHWEVQIKELGGPDYSRTGPRMLDHEGREVNIFHANLDYKFCFMIQNNIKNVLRYRVIEVTSILELQKTFQGLENCLNKSLHHLLVRPELS